MNASGISQVSANSVLAGFAVPVPNGTWRAGVHGPNGREIIQADPTGLSGGETTRNLLVGQGLTHLSTGQGGQSGNVTITVYGREFGPVQSIQLVQGGTTIEGANVVYNPTEGDGQSAEVVFDLTSAPKGTYDLLATAEGGVQHLLKSAFSVADPSPNISVTLGMPDKTRVGRSVSCDITISNQGNVDAFGSVVLDGIPANAAYSFPELPAGVEDAVSTQEKLPGGVGTVQLNEIKVAAGRVIKIPVTFRLDREGSIAVTPHWVGVHQK